MTYSIDFRKKVLEIKEKEGLSINEVASRFMISRSVVFRWSKNIESKNRRNRVWKKIDRDELKRDIEAYPDSYSYERAQRLGVSASGIRYAKRLLGVSYKKNSKSSKGQPRKKIYILPRDKKLKEEGRPIIYIDESGFAHDIVKAV